MIYKRQIQFFHKYSITEFDNLLKESLIYGLFNSIQKLVYSTNSKKDKLNLINEWINNEVVVEIVDDSFVRYVRDNCKSQYKVGYRYITEKRFKHLYLFFKIKKAVMFILKLMRIR